MKCLFVLTGQRFGKSALIEFNKVVSSASYESSRVLDWVVRVFLD